ncbi:nitroreductase [Chloroflexota bacterium]
MDVIEAILERRSIRTFMPDPVPKETLLKILEVATRAPSSGNTQPWEIFVATGRVMERIRQSYLDRYEKKIQGEAEIRSIARELLPAEMLDRVLQMRIERSEAERVEPQHPESVRLTTDRSARLYGTPVVIILCMNRILTTFSVFDHGMLTQNILLAAQNFGIGSIIATATVIHPDILRKELGIPDDLLIVEGIALGYPDKQSPINTFRSSRRPIQEVVTFKD